MGTLSIFEEILRRRGLTTREKRDAFLNPSYDAKHDAFLLPDMKKAVDRLETALKKQENITIYGDYDIDGLTATTILLDAFENFGFKNVSAFIPNRFVEGYGLTVEAVEKISNNGATLIITVDCGSLSAREIERANELGVDVVVTDHHNVQRIQPPAVAIINPKRLLQDFPDKYENFVLKKPSDTLYPFLDLAGCGVAFKLVQALQTRLDHLKDGQEKWLLDLVALGTVCDIVTLQDENRANVFWGLKVLSKTRRPGLKALMAVSKIDPETVTTRSLGFGLGPRMNAAGRLETAQIALDMLRAKDNSSALELAQQLDEMNAARRAEQDTILKSAIIEAEKFTDDNVLVISSPGWNHGIIGIVAAKILEKYKKPTYVLSEMGDESKGSARSYGDFSAADAIRASDDLIIKGGGHKLAAGVTLPTQNIAAFRERVNQFYDHIISNREVQLVKLLPVADTEATFENINEDLVAELAALEPFGSANPQPILKSTNLTVLNLRKMGTEGQHVKLELQAQGGARMQMLAFSAPDYFFVESGVKIDAWYQPDINEWQGRRSVEGKLMHLEVKNID